MKGLKKIKQKLEEGSGRKMNFYFGCFRFQCQQTKTKLKTKTKRKKESTQQNPPLARFLVSSFSPFKLLSFMPFPPSSSSFFLFLFQVLSLSISLSLPLFFSNLVLHLFIFRFYVFFFLIGVSFLVVLWICSFSRFSSIITPSSSSFRVVGSACGWNNEICVSALNLFFEFEIFVVSGTYAISVFGLFSRFTFVVVLHVFLSFFFFFFISSFLTFYLCSWILNLCAVFAGYPW